VELTERLLPRLSWRKAKVSIHTEVAMPIQLFTEAERVQRNHFPKVIAYADLVIFFTLSERDLAHVQGV
jgi:hypothetical protein